MNQLFQFRIPWNLGFLFASLLLVHSSLRADPLHIQVVVSGPEAAYLEFSDVLRKELDTKHFVLTLNQVDDGNPIKNNSGDALIIAVGMKAASKYARVDEPVLDVMVPKSGFESLMKAHMTNLRSAIFIEQPIDRQISFLQHALPGARTIGMLYSVEPQELPALRRITAKRNLTLVEEQVRPDNSLPDALHELLGTSDALLAIPDGEVYNAGTIRNILLATYRRHIPLIGISQAYVKAGALCAIFSTPKQFAGQTADVVRQFANSGRLPSSQYSAEFEISINLQVARSLAIPIEQAGVLGQQVREDHE